MRVSGYREARFGIGQGSRSSSFFVPGSLLGTKHNGRGTGYQAQRTKRQAPVTSHLSPIPFRHVFHRLCDAVGSRCGRVLGYVLCRGFAHAAQATGI